MIIRDKEKYIHSLKSAIAFSFLFLLAHLFFIYTAPYDLYADEAQYWSWSQSIDWGYFSKPPMVAWIIAATGSVCGDTVPCVKLGSPLFHFFTALVMYGIGRRLFSKRVGFWSAITYSTLPGVTLSSYIISTDPPLLFFWALSLYSLIRALQDWHIKWWVLLGIAMGLGMLSKYTMVIFIPSAILYFLISKENRVYLFSFKFWLAIAIAAAIYWRNFAWNRAHGFVSYLHTRDNATGEGLSIHVDKFAEFFGGQFGVFGPILFAVLLFYICMFLPALFKRDTYRLLFSFTLPFLFLIACISLVSRAHANWAAPAYVAATVIVMSTLTMHRALWAKISLILHILVMLIMYNFHHASDGFGIEIDSGMDPFKRVKGQKEFAEKLKQSLAPYESNAVLLTVDRKLHASLLYYLRDKKGNPPLIIHWNGNRRIDNHYDLTTTMEDFTGKDFLLVTAPVDIRFVSKHFDEAEKVKHITVPVYKDYQLEYDLHHLKHFNGYH